MEKGFTSQFKGAEIDELLLKVKNNEVSTGGGVPIVSSVEELDANASAGSIAVVAKQGTSQVVSFRDLYQPDASILDPVNMSLTDPSLPSGVNKLVITAPPTGTEFSYNAVVYLVPRDLSATNLNIIALRGGMYMRLEAGNQSNHEIFNIDDDGNYTIIQESVDYINEKLASDEWCYIDGGLLEGGNPMTSSDFDSLDLWVKAQSGNVSTAEAFIKKDEWETLDAKAIKAIDIASEKESKRKFLYIKDSFYDDPYFTVNEETIGFVHSSGYNTARVYIEPSTKDYAEYVVHFYDIKNFVFRNRIGNENLNILWANGEVPSISANTHYEVNIVAVKVEGEVIYKGVCTAFA